MKQYEDMLLEFSDVIGYVVAHAAVFCTVAPEALYDILRKVITS